VSEANKQVVQQFFAALKHGELPDRLLTTAMSAWTLTSGETNKQRFQMGIRLLAQIIDGELEYEILNLICDNHGAVAEVKSEWRLVNGDQVKNDHVFIFLIHQGLISQVREYMHPSVPQEKLGPLIQAALQKP